MKLDTALNHRNNIKRLTEELNSAISDAVKDGAFIETDIGTMLEIGGKSTPVIDVSVLVNPLDLE